MSNPVAKAIIDQLGGGKFVAMTGAKNFVGLENGVMFKLPGNPGFVYNGINTVLVTLTPADVYDVEFKRVTGRLDRRKEKTVAKVEGVYCDQLGEIFREKTGLETRMPRIRMG